MLNPEEACQAPGTGVTQDNCDDDQPRASTPFDFKISFNLNVKTKGYKVLLKTWNTDNNSASNKANEILIENDSDQILVPSKEFLQISKEPKFKIVQEQNKTGVSDEHGSNRLQTWPALINTQFSLGIF